MIAGSGIDMVEAGRIRRAAERFGSRFLSRIYTQAEREYCEAKGDPWPSFAARFAAKEAAMKVLRTGRSKGVAWLDIEVRTDKDGAPLLALKGEAQRRAEGLGIKRWHLSMSHTHSLALVIVVAEEDS